MFLFFLSPRYSLPKVNMKTRVASAGLLNLHYFKRATFLRHKNEWLIIVDDNNFLCWSRQDPGAFAYFTLRCRISFSVDRKVPLGIRHFLRWLKKIFPFRWLHPEDDFSLPEGKKLVRRFWDRITNRILIDGGRIKRGYWREEDFFWEPLCGFSANFGGRCFFFSWGHQFPSSFFFVPCHVWMGSHFTATWNLNFS